MDFVTNEELHQTGESRARDELFKFENFLYPMSSSVHSKRTQSHFLCTLLFSVYSSSSCSLKKAAFFWATRASRCFLAIFLRLNLKTLITLSETAQQKVHHIIDRHKGTKHSFLCKFHPTQLISPRRIGTPHLK